MKSQIPLTQRVALIIFGSVLVQSVIAQEHRSQDTGGINYSFALTPIYQLKTNLNKGGDFSVSSVLLSFGANTMVNPSWSIGVGLNYSYDDYNFSGGSKRAPWNNVSQLGLNLPLFWRVGNNWNLSLVPSAGYTRENGAKLDESWVYGAVFSAAYTFNPNLTLGAGIGAFRQLEENRFFPFLAVNWKINDQLRLSNPFRAGPAGPAGLELIFTPDEKWEFGAGGAYRSYRFRLDDQGETPNGIGKNNFLPLFVRVSRQLNPQFKLDLYTGAMLNGELKLENQNGEKLSQDDYDAAPFLALSVSGRF